MLETLINKIIGDPNTRLIKKITPLIEQAKAWEEKFQTEITAENIKDKTQEFKERLKKGETLDEILPEAFALVKIACRALNGQTHMVRGESKTWDMIPFDVQLLGGIVLHQGNIAEMKTGEGKTLVCTLPTYLNALTEKGVFVVTVNEYLAQRDAEWMKPLYETLGLTVGVIKTGQNFDEKKAAYACDITYGTNNEFGFDYLRDNMASNLDQIVQRHLNFAIVDEVDSILIDEARTPLIISAPAEESTLKYKQYSSLVRNLIENVHYNIDEKMRTATLTEAGIAKMEELLGIENIYTEAGFQEVHHLEQALKANFIFKRDIDYVVKDGEIIIVDEFTGRLMAGRRYSNGLHQAIEAKEAVEIKRESRTLASITFQNYFRLFEKLAGMTGTAITEAEEFGKIYGLDTYAIPTNKPIARLDKNDAIYKNIRGKYAAVVETVKELHQKGQPVLVGTVSIEKSELISSALQKAQIPHNVLNAKQHEKEAEIIARAGEKGAVTIATNMAGRGTDIKVGEEVKTLGGLYVIGTERHESRRIDNQLRGRSGRQGDPGASQFFISMEDDLMRLFGADRIRRFMEFANIPDDMPIENKMISRTVENAQKKVEGHHFDTRKHVVEYDDVMNAQREIIYARRRKILEAENLKNEIVIAIEQEVEKIVLFHTNDPDNNKWNYQEIFENINSIHKDQVTPLALAQIQQITNQEDLIDKIKHHLLREYTEKESLLPTPEIMRQLEKQVYLRVIDTLWMEHIDQLSYLRDRVSLMGYGQRDPLIAYKQEAFDMFEKLIGTIQSNLVNTLFKVKLVAEPIKTETEQSPNHQITSKKTHLDPSLINKKTGPNEECPCGSGKKFKKCHG